MLCREVESLFAEAEKVGEASDEVIFAVARYYAKRGLMQDCLSLIRRCFDQLTKQMSSFIQTTSLLLGIAERDESLVKDAMGIADVKSRWRTMSYR